MAHTTSLTLLEELGDFRNEESWERFFKLYEPLIVRFCEQVGCGDKTMQQDIVQETMFSLMRILPDFDYDQRQSGFRALLYTIVRNHVRSAWRRLKKLPLTTGIVDHQNAVADNHPASDPEKVWDLLWRKHVLAQALRRVRAQIEPITYESFVQYVLAGRPAAAVAAELDLTPNAVHQHRHRVIGLLQREVARLSADVDPVPILPDDGQRPSG